MGRRETDHEAETEESDSQPSYRDPRVETPSPPAREKALTPEETLEKLRAFYRDMAARKGWK
jgi:hypothetical protein